MERRLAGMEQAVRELKGLQVQMAEFHKSKDSIVTLLTRMESQILKMERVESDIEDEYQGEEKDSTVDRSPN